MMNVYRLNIVTGLLCFGLFLFVGFASQAQTLGPPIKTYTGLAMHGDAALPDGFDHFSYAYPNAPKGGAIRHAEIGSFDSLNPHIVKGKAAAGMGLVFDRLMARSWDEPFTLYPRIAKSVEMPFDRSWMIIHLDERAKFHDGQAILSDDVLFTFEQLKTKGRPNFRNVYNLVEKAEAFDRYTVRFDFKKEANLETPMIMALMPVYAKHIWQDREFDQTTLEPFISTGPYRVKSIEPGRQIVYERVQDYWAKDLPSAKGQYNFDEIIYDYYRDENVALEAFKSGDFDFRREWDANKWEQAYNFDAVDSGDVTKEVIPHKRPEWVRSLIFNTRRFPFERLQTRKALGYALDFEWMNKTLLGGAFKRIASIYPNSELAASGNMSDDEKRLITTFEKELSPFELDQQFIPPSTDGTGRSGIRKNLKVAQDLLSKDGWILEDGRLIDEKTKQPFVFEILLQDPKQEKIALEFSRNLKILGIEANIRTVDSAQFFARLNEYDFDMVLYKWHSTLSPGNEQSFYWGSKFADIPGSRNYPAIRLKSVDFLANEIAEAKTRQELVTAARTLDRVIMAGHYFVPLYYDGTDKMAYWNYLKRPDYIPLYGPVLESWWYEDQMKEMN